MNAFSAIDPVRACAPIITVTPRRNRLNMFCSWPTSVVSQHITLLIFFCRSWLETSQSWNGKSKCGSQDILENRWNLIQPRICKSWFRDLKDLRKQCQTRARDSHDVFHTKRSRELSHPSWGFIISRSKWWTQIIAHAVFTIVFDEVICCLG